MAAIPVGKGQNEESQVSAGVINAGIISAGMRTEQTGTTMSQARQKGGEEIKIIASNKVSGATPE